MKNIWKMRKLPLFRSIFNYFAALVIAAFESEIRFDPSITDLGDLAIFHAIRSLIIIV
jgi:hypothetical protein